MTNIPDPSAYYDHAAHKKDWEHGELLEVREYIAHASTSGALHDMLEVGCGRAEIRVFLPSEVRYTGIDPTPYENMVVGRGEALPFLDRSFDLVFSTSSLEHVQDPRRVLAEMIRVLRPGGAVIILAPNLEMPWSNIHAVRHYRWFQKLVFMLRRWINVKLRFFGILPFHMLRENFTQATGRYERSDDDLTYVTSTFEVATFLKRGGLREEFARRFATSRPTIKNRLKRFLIHIGPFRYAFTGMYLRFRKPRSRE